MDILRRWFYLLIVVLVLSFVIRYLWPLVILLLIVLAIQYYRFKKEIEKQKTTSFQDLQQDLFYEQAKKKEYEGEIIDAEYEEKESRE